MDVKWPSSNHPELRRVSESSPPQTTSDDSTQVSPSFLSKVQTAVASVFGYIANFFGSSSAPNPAPDSNSTSFLANSCAGPLSQSGYRYTVFASQADDEVYQSILHHSQEVNGDSPLIPGAPLYVCTLPELDTTEKSLYPEIPYAKMINWFLSRKNIDGIKDQTNTELAQPRSLKDEIEEALQEIEQETLKELADIDLASSPASAYTIQSASTQSATARNQVKDRSIQKQKLVLGKTLGAQFIKDILRPGQPGAKTYVMLGQTFTFTKEWREQLSKMEEYDQINELCDAVFGQGFTVVNPDELRAVMCLTSQNSGITAHNIVFELEKQKNPNLACALVDPSKICESYTLTKETDDSFTFTYDYTSNSYRFLYNDETIQEKPVHVVFSINLNKNTEPQLYYSYAAE